MMAKKYKFDIVEQVGVDFDINLYNVKYVIRTDGGKKFIVHHSKETINQHTYIQEIMAPDSSSLNGIAKQPHPTL